jgi:hypothetical protein
MEKMRYLLSLFLYAVKEKKIISIHTLFRYVYIFKVSNTYLNNNSETTETITIDKNLGIGDYSLLNEAMQDLNLRDYITIIDNINISVKEKLLQHVNNLLTHEKVKQDLNKILYFTEIVSSYSEDVILTVFFNEPNYQYAVGRNQKAISLSNNKLKQLLADFEKIANEEYNNKLDKYDVFTSWLDFVFEEYVRGKDDDEEFLSR